MYNLGAFVRHVVRGFTADLSEPQRQVVRREVQEQVHQTGAGKVTLRRTTIEEVEIERGGGGEAGEGRT